MTAFNSKGTEDKKNWLLHYTFSEILTTSSFYVVLLQRTAKKCTKIQNARAEPLFCSLNLLFGDVLVVAAAVV